MEKDQLELIRRIASVVGHELRNPLAVINNSAYFLKSKLGSAGRLDAKVEKHLAIVASEIDRVNRMITDLLALPRALELKAESAPLNAWLEGALRGYPFPEGVRLKKILSRDNPRVPIDAAALEDALRRVLDNACEAMEAAGTLTVKTEVRDGRVALEILDSGPGIKPEARGRLFEPFFTTKPRGLGLGLALAKKAAQAHGAKIDASSPSGGGALLTISWPDKQAR